MRFNILNWQFSQLLMNCLLHFKGQYRTTAENGRVQNWMIEKEKKRRKKLSMRIGHWLQDPGALSLGGHFFYGSEHFSSCDTQVQEKKAQGFPPCFPARGGHSQEPGCQPWVLPFYHSSVLGRRL
jgi:hypothetical protein